MTCPFCQARLSLVEYAWAHTHPSEAGRRLGALIMAIGAVVIWTSILEIAGVIK